MQLHPEIKVIVSDLEMPRINGFELLSNFREYTNLAKIPVVILTSRSIAKIKELMNSNADDLDRLLIVKK